MSQIPNNGSAVEPDNNTSAKSIIHYKNCTLFPPNANAPAPTTRDRPQGCKTVFVGGLPENVKGLCLISKQKSLSKLPVSTSIVIACRRNNTRSIWVLWGYCEHKAE